MIQSLPQSREDTKSKALVTVIPIVDSMEGPESFGLW